MHQLTLIHALASVHSLEIEICAEVLVFRVGNITATVVCRAGYIGFAVSCCFVLCQSTFCSVNFKIIIFLENWINFDSLVSVGA